jgi:hypothetical protein
MNRSDELRQATARVLDHDDIDGVLGQTFYGTRPPQAPAAPAAKDRPQHYKVICISMYTDDLERLDEMVQTLKARGLTKANRSALIRYALGAVKLDDVPKGL